MGIIWQVADQLCADLRIAQRAQSAWIDLNIHPAQLRLWPWNGDLPSAAQCSAAIPGAIEFTASVVQRFQVQQCFAKGRPEIAAKPCHRCAVSTACFIKRKEIKAPDDTF